MKMNEVRTIARSQGIVPGRKNKTELVWEIQKREGNEVCCGSRKECGRYDCRWRSICLPTAADS